MASSIPAAIAAFASDVAALPRLYPYQFYSTVNPLRDVVWVKSLDSVAGQVLPHSDDTWLMLQPFEDIKKSTTAYMSKLWMQLRSDLIALLAMLAVTPGESEWTPALCATPSHGTDGALRGTPFWINLMRELDQPSTYRPEVRDTERGLAALRHAVQPKFLLLVPRDPQLVDFAQLLEWFLLDHGQPHPAYTNLLQQCGVATPTNVGLVVEICILFEKGKITVSLATQLVALLAKNESQFAADEHAIHFRVTTIRLEKACVIQPKAAEVLGQWVQCSFDARLHIGSVNANKPAPLQPFLRSLFCPQSHLARLRLDDPAQAMAMASVLRYTPGSLQALDIPFDPSGEYAAWLAFAVFHVDSLSRVSSIVLRVPESDDNAKRLISNEWIDGFQATLHCTTGSKRFLAQIDEAADSTERIFVTVAANTTAKDSPYFDSSTLRKLHGEYEKIGEAYTSVAVVVPGIGVGWISVASVKSTRTQASAVPTDKSLATNGMVTSFHWTTSNFNFLPLRESATGSNHDANLVQLLRLIGGPLERLSLPNLLLTDAQLAPILQSCPRVQELNISGHFLRDIQPLVDAFRCRRSRIHTLSIVRSHLFKEAGPMPH